MKEPPERYYICPCCGTEFENDDKFIPYIELTHQWVLSGMPWFSRATAKPENWNSVNQLADAGLGEVLMSNLQGSEPIRSVSVGGPVSILEKISIGFSGSLLSHA